jgi:hypothetical protein
MLKNLLGMILAVGNVLNARVKGEKVPKNYLGQADGFDYKVLEKVAMFKDNKTGSTLISYICKQMVDQHDNFRSIIKETIDKMGVIN